MTDDARADRNLVAAATAGSVLLPLVGLVGALLFLLRGERGTAAIVLAASLAGAAVWALLIAG